MLGRALAALAAALAALGAWASHDPRDAAFVEKARREGGVTLYTSMQLVDSRPLAQAFERKHGIKVSLWRASGEKVQQRVLAEARAARFEADVIETDAAQMEILFREQQLARLLSPSLHDIPQQMVPGHGTYAPTRLNLYVMAWNTDNVLPHQVPKTYRDLLDPKWTGRFALESEDVAWFAAVTKAMGEEDGLAYFRRLAGMRPVLRHGHTLMAELVAAGDVDIALDAHVQGVARLQARGAPIDWRPLQPAFGQPSAVGIAQRAPHPHAAQLLADFILSREGQEIIRSRNRVPASAAVDSPLNQFPYELIDPAILLDDWDKWSRLWSGLFLGGKPLGRD